MKKYAVIDIGSNTTVFAVYLTDNGLPVRIFHESRGIHLLSYEKNRHLSADGLKVLKQTLDDFQNLAAEQRTDEILGLITEPWRAIDNSGELFELLNRYPFPVHALSGEQEARCDYEACRASYPEVREGLIFDIGGGSTELIFFGNSGIRYSASIPVGCVRLTGHPEALSFFRQKLREIPLKPQAEDVIIGIGGTARTTRKLHNALYDKNTLTASSVRQLISFLDKDDSTARKIRAKHISPDRLAVYPAGIKILEELTRLFPDHDLLISDYGVREGFLISHLKNPL